MRKGFSLLEFLAFCALLLAASTLLIPRALAPRRALNEAQAVGYLAMIGTAERAWHEETGAYVALQRAVLTGPARAARDAVTLPPLLPPDFLFDGAGVAHRGGYRFRLGRAADGGIAGCWAWPNLEGFSGAETYWSDFASGTVRRVSTRYSWKDAPPETPPAVAEFASGAPAATF